MQTGRRLAYGILIGLVACGGPERSRVDEQTAGANPSVRPPASEDSSARLPTAELPPRQAATPDEGDSLTLADTPSASSIPSDARNGEIASAPAGSAAPAPAAPVASPSGSTTADDILARAEASYADIRSMQADFVQRIYVPLLDSTQDSRGQLFHRAPDRFLMRFTEPEGDIIVADGVYGWMYYPSTDPLQVMRSRLSEGTQRLDLQREFLSNATERFDATLTGTEPVGGRPAYALTLTPRGSSPYQRIRIWVDADDHLVRRFEITEQNESVRNLELSNLRTNVTLEDDLFEFTPPPGAEVFEP